MNFVTGATGHIGNVLVRELVARGERVRALLFPGEDRRPLEGLAVEIVEGDVLDSNMLRRAMRGARRVFHLAGIISIMPGKQETMRQVNVEGTKNVIAACREAHVERLIYTSSIHAIAAAPEGQVIDESLPFDPNRAWGGYDKTKAEASRAVQHAVQEGLDAVIVCPTGVIGPHDYRGSMFGEFLMDCASPRPHMYIDGAYDFVDVRDVARGHILAAERGRCGEAYILSGGRITVRQIIEAVEDFTGRFRPKFKVPVWLVKTLSYFTPVWYRAAKRTPRFTPYSIHTVLSNSHISADKARRELGYKSRPLVQSIADAVAWMVSYRRLKLVPERVEHSPQPALGRRPGSTQRTRRRS